jgi:hypothetical protein
MEQQATRSLRKEGRRIQRRLSPGRQPRYSQQRNPSPGAHPTASGHRRPRISPPDLHSVPTVNTEPPALYSVPTLNTEPPTLHSVPTLNTEPPDLHSVPIPNTAPTGSAHTDNTTIRPLFHATPNNGSTRDNSPISHIDPLHRRQPVPPEPRSAPTRPRKPQEPTIYGSIIHDDGTEIRESMGEWRPEASQLLRQSTDSILSKVDTALLSLSRPKERDSAVRRDSPDLEASGSAEQQGIVRAEVEFIEGSRRSSKAAGTSPYKAVPPFLDEDWKGIRRSPSS